VTTTSAKPSVWATASSCCRRTPVVSRNRFDIDLPRARDINSPDLPRYSTKIIQALKAQMKNQTTEVAE